MERRSFMQSKLKNPMLFQGNLKKKHYFEGWYFKQVSEDEKTVLSFIPGVSLDGEHSHAFIQAVLVEKQENGIDHTQTHYFKYPIEEVHFQNEPFLLKIGTSIFSETFLSVDLKSPELNMKGKIGFGSFQRIKTSLSQPTIMGPFGYLPSMECYHGIVSMNHSLEGFVRINGNLLLFKEGKGYIERDWGTSFPEKYLWVQSNHFEEKDTSFFFSIAKIPYHFTSFEGFIANFQVGKREYRFATYNQSTCMVEKPDTKSLLITLESQEATLQAHVQYDHLIQLPAPQMGKMERFIDESLSATIELTFHDKKRSFYYHGNATTAGIDVVKY